MPRGQKPARKRCVRKFWSGELTHPTSTYAGPLGHVLSRLLAGYNYAIKQDDAEIDVIIVSRYGEQAIPAPIIVQRRGSGE
jgi:hypothetical protein